jgi:hypothetical protein
MRSSRRRWRSAPAAGSEEIGMWGGTVRSNAHQEMIGQYEWTWWIGYVDHEGRTTNHTSGAQALDNTRRSMAGAGAERRRQRLWHRH